MVRLFLSQRLVVFFGWGNLQAGWAVCHRSSERKAAKPAQGVAVVVADYDSLVRVLRTVKKVTGFSPARQVIHDGVFGLEILMAPHPGGPRLVDLIRARLLLLFLRPILTARPD